MIKLTWKSFLSAVFIGLVMSGGYTRAAASDVDLQGIVKKYLAARQATMLQASSMADVDALLAFYADDVVYEHPRVKMKIEGKATMKEGMARFLGLTRDASIVTLNQISNLNVVVAEYQVTFKTEDKKSWKEVTRKQVSLFEFEGEKIKRVVDYW